MANAAAAFLDLTTDNAAFLDLTTDNAPVDLDLTEEKPEKAKGPFVMPRSLLLQGATTGTAIGAAATHITFGDGGYIQVPPGGRIEVENNTLWGNLGGYDTTEDIQARLEAITQNVGNYFVGAMDTPQTRAAMQAATQNAIAADPVVRRVLHNNTDGWVTLTNPRPGEIIWNYQTDATGTVTGDRGLFNAATMINGIDFTNTGTTTATITFDGTGSISSGYFTPQNKKQLLKQFMKQNLLIKQSNSRSLDLQISPEELKARNTLRDLITEKEWRRYVTNGFIMVKGQSGKWYQIFNKKSGYLVQVFENNKLIHGLCIHTVTDCPPSDHVINMKVLVELDEEQIYKGANVRNYGQEQAGFDAFRVTNNTLFTASPGMSLSDYAKQLEKSEGGTNMVFTTVNTLAYGA